MNRIIQTTGGILHSEDVQNITNYICDVFNCNPEAISDLKPLQKGFN